MLRAISLCESQEVFKHHVPVLGKDRFRVELHTKSWVIAMCEGHDLALVGTRSHRKTRCA